MILIVPIYNLEEAEAQALLEVWTASVRDTHDFLTAEDITALKPEIASALKEAPILKAAYTAAGPVGFIGVSADKIEMLFIHPDYRGQGLGRQLLEAAAFDHPLHYVDVNEQNPEALGFYEHMGFRLQSRSSQDSAGRPWPILHLVR